MITPVKCTKDKKQTKAQYFPYHTVLIETVIENDCPLNRKCERLGGPLDEMMTVIMPRRNVGIMTSFDSTGT